MYCTCASAAASAGPTCSVVAPISLAAVSMPLVEVSKYGLPRFFGKIVIFRAPAAPPVLSEAPADGDPVTVGVVQALTSTKATADSATAVFVNFIRGSFRLWPTRPALASGTGGWGMTPLDGVAPGTSTSPRMSPGRV